MHHIGLSSTDKLYDEKIAALPAASQKAAQWMGALGEGLAVLAAAGGTDVPPNQYSQSDVQQNWEHGMSNFNQDLQTLNEFFSKCSMAVCQATRWIKRPTPSLSTSRGLGTQSATKWQRSSKNVMDGQLSSNACWIGAYCSSVITKPLKK
jgi:hypothetical protein